MKVPRRQSDIEAPGGCDAAAELKMYRLLVENVADLIVRGDANWRRIYVSPSSREMLGYEPAELRAFGTLDLVHPDDRARARANRLKLGPLHPTSVLAFRMRRKDGDYIWVEGTYRYMPEDNGVLAVMRDVTARKQAEDALAEVNAQLAEANRALEALALRDGLTGLANRRGFDAQLAEEWRRAGRQRFPIALVLFDIDCFKLFNDCYGHLAGDDCLRQVCDAVVALARRPGDFAARYGGEELAVLLPGTDDAGAALIAEQMRAAVERLGIRHLGSREGVVTISAGVAALVPAGGGEKPHDLVAAADCALYQAKTAGRNRVRVTDAVGLR